MPYQINFGDLAVAKSPPVPKKGRKFRLAVLGDFSARANRGELETGDVLADRKTLAVDVDNLDDILARFAPKVNIALPGSGTVELEFASMEDFHPDQLYGKLEIFSNLSGLRQRLKTTSTFAKAAKEMREAEVAHFLGGLGEGGGRLEPLAQAGEIGKDFQFPVKLVGMEILHRGKLQFHGAGAGQRDVHLGREPGEDAVDVDNLDDILARFAPKVNIALPGSGTVELEFASMEDFHPDQLYGKLEIFSNLSGLRQRLKTTSTFAKAAKEMRDLGLAPAAPAKRHVKKKKARGTVIPTDAKLSDFARLMGQPTAAPDEDAPDPKSSLDAFLRGIVGPTLVANKDPQQDKLVAAADEALGAMMREVLHHPDFQALESLWRSVDFLVRRVETDETLQLILVDMSAEEFAADLSSSDALEDTALYKLFVEGPAEDAKNGMFSAIIANYVFERTPPHADLLGRMAKIAAGAQAPFIAALASNTIDQKTNEIHELTRDAWDALRALPEAGFLGLALPRFMLRMPYGKGTDPIDSFKFEEFTMQAGLSALLWANPAVAVGLLLAETFRKLGDQMRVGTVTSIGDMPFYFYEDADGDQTALPCTERYLTSRTQEAVAAQGFLPLLAVKNSPEIRVGNFRAVSGGLLAGWWLATPDPVKAPAPAPAEAAEEAAPEEAAPTDETPSDETPAEDAPASDPELDALLASTSAEAETPPADEEAMDPDLAKLLAELG